MLMYINITSQDVSSAADRRGLCELRTKALRAGYFLGRQWHVNDELTSSASLLE